jgi:hypothetical protein
MFVANEPTADALRTPPGGEIPQRGLALAVRGALAGEREVTPHP